MLVPKIVTTLKSYNRSQFLADLTAGVIVGIIALPLAIAFAIASGVSPDRGLYTAIVAGFIISAFGGSRVLGGKNLSRAQFGKRICTISSCVREVPLQP